MIITVHETSIPPYMGGLDNLEASWDVVDTYDNVGSSSSEIGVD